MIAGVVTKKLDVKMDDRGYLMEILRSDEPIFAGFGQCYVTSVFPGIVKAWHMHRLQEDHICALTGNIKLVLYDGRESSETHGDIDEFYIGEQNPMLVKIPREVYHGFTSLDGRTAVIMNLPTMPYDREDPDEERLPWDTLEIGYSWEIKNR